MKKLSDLDAEKLLKRYRIPVPTVSLAKKEEDAVKKARSIGYPVVMKISSPKISHKTDIGGVIVGVKTDEEVRNAFKKIMKNARKHTNLIDGVLVQEMANGIETILGSKVDPQFGHIILFGTGGILVEVIKDFSIRLIPIEKRDASEMIKEIKGYKILKGVRGNKAVDFNALEDCLMNLSRMIEKNPQIQELDINPLFVDHKGVVAADYRIFVK
ncbi:MAG: acetate--CoA ligase family protein [Candidatus Aenigmatarchaeota archaeon]|nr:acetate--CoA ligase family protein [Nanoarchaeota archaeon]